MSDKQKATYKVRNTSLDAIFKKYEIESTDELLQFGEDKLIDALRDAHSMPYFAPTKKTQQGEESYMGVAGPKYKLIPHISVERLVAENTVEVFMPIDYWRSEHKSLARDRDLYTRLDKASTGAETMQLMTTIKVGISLKPGEEAETTWTDAFVEEILKKSPFLTKMSVEKIGGEKIEREKPVEEGQTVSERNPGIKIEDLDYRTLQQMAREKDIPFIGKPKTELIRKLMELEKK